jgi:hypothetical protein
MSILKKLGKGLKKIGKGAVKVGRAYQAVSNPTAYAMQLSYTGASSRSMSAAPPSYSNYGDPGMSMMRTGGRAPARLGGGSMAGQVGRQIGQKVPGIAGKVAGGLLIIGGYLYDAMGNRVGRAPGARKRSKGITANELKGFTRVTHILDKYCKIKPPGGARRTTHRTSRAKTCR